MADGHHHPSLIGRKLRIAFGLTMLILAVELAGGLYSNSLALLSDSGHVFTDLIALGLAWFATEQAEKPANEHQTYGYHRTGILTALANSATLLVIVATIAYEAILRLQHPEVVVPTFMFAAAAVGILVNLYIGLSLQRAQSSNLNVRAAMLHVFGDVGASAAVVIAGVVISLTGWYPIDPLLSLAIALLIARGAWGILGESVSVLMEAAPPSVNLARLIDDLTCLPEIKDIHDLHVWSLAGGMPILTAHVQLTGDCRLSTGEDVLLQINQLLRQRYHITHTTIQLECAGCLSSDLYCTIPVPVAHDRAHHHDDHGRHGLTGGTPHLHG